MILSVKVTSLVVYYDAVDGARLLDLLSSTEATGETHR
jgi:hypothetical protein